LAITERRRGVSSVQSIESAMSRIWHGKDGGWMEIRMNEGEKPRWPRINEMPLYPTEAQIARAVLGDRAKDWKRIAKVLEDKEGLPKINELMGGRFWPAVVAFFYGWQHISLDNTRVAPTMRPGSRSEMVPPPVGRKT
jgi:hypothetical protein